MFGCRGRRVVRGLRVRGIMSVMKSWWANPTLLGVKGFFFILWSGLRKNVFNHSCHFWLEFIKSETLLYFFTLLHEMVNSSMIDATLNLSILLYYFPINTEHCKQYWHRKMNWIELMWPNRVDGAWRWIFVTYLK